MLTGSPCLNHQGGFMRERLLFLLPNVKEAQSSMRHLLLARIDDRHIHVLAKDSIDLEDLPGASVGQRSDYFHAMALGIVVGGTTGIIGGLAAYYLTPGINVDLSGIGLMALLGSVFGIWISGMIGTDVPNSAFRKFAKDIEKGRILMMVDVPKARAEEIRQMMHKRHPKATDSGIDPMYPVFP
jgi:hypothetical protein